MPNLKIDNIEVKVPEGVSVLAAAHMKGIDIPSMCYREGKEHFTSCMICMVKDKKTGKLFPSCSVKASEGMEIITRDEEIEESRKTALELLLSDHVGDCEAPCQITCPAHMNIPLMNRLLAEGKFHEALKVVKQDIALPAVFGRICPAPCEGACRRKSVDSAVSICLLKRYAGDYELENPAGLPAIAKTNGKKIAIIGAGPAGLAAAYYLQLRGYQCDVYFKGSKAGGTLWQEVENGKLEEEILEKEIASIGQIGTAFFPGVRVDKTMFGKLKKEYAALIIATGSGDSGVEDWGLDMSEKGIKAEKGSFVSSQEDVFVAGSAIRASKLAIRALGQGKEVAFSVDQFLRGKPVVGEIQHFNSRFGKLLSEELPVYMMESIESDRQEVQDILKGFTLEQVIEEAARCLHCDCRAIDDCKLRSLSDEYKANQKRFWSEDRMQIEKYGFEQNLNKVRDEFVIYEPAKCIKCGRCVHITEENRDIYGMSFIGRGFDVVVNVPFGEPLNEGLKELAMEVVRECPTGALSNKK